jgi:hypothetical protein
VDSGGAGVEVAGDLRGAGLTPGDFLLRRASAPGFTVYVSHAGVSRVQHQFADGLVDLAFGSFFETRRGLR